MSYRAVVIRGLIHNGHPDADELWMPPGSFWTQPKGGVHITAAQGQDVLAIVEIEEGPYLVHPVDEAFDTTEPARNLVPGEIAWSAAPASDGVEVAPLWGDGGSGGPSGTLIQLSSGEATVLDKSVGTLHAVVVSGRPTHRAQAGGKTQELEPGCYLSSTGSAKHSVVCGEGTDCILYVRTTGGESKLGSP